MAEIMKKNIFLYSSLVLLALTLTYLVNTPDPDFWVRLAVGSLFFQTGGVLRQDIFAYSPTKSLWIDHEWGSGVIFYFFAKYLGSAGIYFLKFLLILAILLLVDKIIRLQGKIKDIHSEALYFIFLSISLIPFIAGNIRCQIFTYVFFALWIYVLERIKRGENRIIWILPVTIMIWANLHGGFIAGLGLIAIYAAGEYINKADYKKFLLIFLITLPFTLINPYGIKYITYIAGAITMPRPGIEEWAPISLIEKPMRLFGLYIYRFAGFVYLTLFSTIVIAGWFIKKIKPDWTRILLFIGLVYTGFSHKRNAVFLIIASGSLFYHYYMAMFFAIFNRLSSKFTSRAPILLIWVKNIVTYFILSFVLINFIHLPKEMIVAPDQYPVGSLEFIKQNNLSGNILAPYRWGNYVLWKLYPHCHVFGDGRYEEVYPDEVFADVMNFSRHFNDNWVDIVRRYNTDIIIAPKEFYKASDLLSLKDWVVVYEDLSSFLLLPAKKIKNNYLIPNYNNELYRTEDYGKSVELN